MTNLAGRFSYDDLRLMLPDGHEGDRYELIAGKLFMTPSPTPLHQLVVGHLMLEFGGPTVTRERGEVLTWVDVVLSPDSVVVPDLIFIGRDQLGIIGETAIEGTPDLIVEVLSSLTRRRDLVEKRALYERFGVREYWLVDPDERTATVLVRRAGQFDPLPAAGGFVRSSVVPSIAVDVAALFAVPW